MGGGAAPRRPRRVQACASRCGIDAPRRAGHAPGCDARAPGRAVRLHRLTRCTVQTEPRSGGPIGSGDSMPPMSPSTNPSSAAPLVRLRGVSRRYATGGSLVHALRDVTLDLPGGAFVAVVGRSGSGKSTLLHLLAAMDQPTSGSVTVGPWDIGALSRREAARYREDDEPRPDCPEPARNSRRRTPGDVPRARFVRAAHTMRPRRR